MAGLGSRFVERGYEQIKPLIEVRPGVPMIEAVVDSVGIDGDWIFIIQKAHDEQTNVREVLSRIRPEGRVVVIDGPTQGAACTVAAAKDLIDGFDPLIVVNSDNILDWDGQATYDWWLSPRLNERDGLIATFNSDDPRYSFVRIDENNCIVEVAEKKVISNTATAGLYGWSYAVDFFAAVDHMIAADDRVNGEFYVAPVFNHNLSLVPWFSIVPAPIREFIGVGTPEELDAYKTRMEGQ